MHLYLGEEPRTLYLVNSSRDGDRPRRALVFRAADRNPSQAIVEFLPADEVDLRSAIRLSSRDIKGCLGLICIANELFLAVVTSSVEIGNTRPTAATPECVARIHEIGFFSLTSSTWDDLTAASEALPSPGLGEYGERDSYAQNPATQQTFEHPCAALAKMFTSGSFYYATEPPWDLSSRLSQRLLRRDDTIRDVASFDERFVWNEYLVRSLLDFRGRLDALEREDFDKCQFIILAIQGYVGLFTIPLPAPPTSGTPTIATLTLISRLGRKRAGTRFITRGVDDDGNCANFVETETLFSTDQNCFSYVQVRGSIPLFWEQQGLQTFGHKIQITRPHASQPAFDRHFAEMTEEYGPVHAVNLLGTKENEQSLTAAYARHIDSARGVFGDDIGITHFDFHNSVRIGGHDAIMHDLRRLRSVQANIDRFGFTMCDSTTDALITEQKGSFRINCLDCLDRTNFVEDIMSRTTLEQYLMLVRKEWLQSGSLWTYHRELWAENGDALSRVYAGTGALNTSFTRSGKRTLAGVLSDATKSVSRAYINNFQDKSKQAAIDMFLGNLSNQRQVTVFDPIHDSIRAALDQRLPEYSTTKQCTIYAGTWNLNGRPPSESLLPWLFARPDLPEPDIFVIGFQEIVALTAQQIVQADPEKRRTWETRLLENLNRRPNKKADFVLLRSEQLVGTAIVLLVKSDITAVLRRVEGASRKTGLRGMSGNKGAVAIRLDYHDTSFCFVTAHLAAGHSNVDERNADYRTISDGLRFQKGRTIDNHDNVVWLADTNYRIDLENDVVRSYALNDDLDPLLAADQLRDAMDAHIVFSGYTEGPILFRPTYKYDVGTDTYDTSEKLRVPAWTDRILYKGSQLDLRVYSRAELRGSDHKPVLAIFNAGVRVIDQAKRAAISQMLADNVVSTAPGEKLDEKLAALTFSSSEDQLPPPSSDDSAWWNVPDNPNGLFIESDQNGSLNGFRRSTNPFDSPNSSPSALSSSPSSSEEELYATLQSPANPAQAARKPPPPPPPRSTKPGALNADGGA